MLLETAYKSRLKIVIINLLYLSVPSAQILPLRATRWHCKNIHCICSLSAFIATKYCQTHLHILHTPTRGLITIYLRGLTWEGYAGGWVLWLVTGCCLSPRPLCRPLSLGGGSAGAGQGCRAPLQPHNTPCVRTESRWSSHKIEGYPKAWVWSLYEIQGSQLCHREPAWHISPHFLSPYL